MNLRLCHSFWTKPLADGRWGVQLRQRLASNIWLYALSAVFAKLSGAEIVLHTDAAGKNLLGFIPYDRIYLTLDAHDYDSQFWASGKIIAQEAEPPGSIHIDGDVFIKSKNTIDPGRFTNSDLIVQSAESAGGCLYGAAIDGVRDVLKARDPGLFAIFDPGRWTAYNCGVAGFNNQRLKDDYIAGYKRLYELLRTDRPYHHKWCPDLAVGQAWLHRIAAHHNSDVYCLLGPDNNGDDAKRIRFTHLIGQAKYDAGIITRVGEILNHLAPDVYKACNGRINGRDFIELAGEDTVSTTGVAG
jgi:hypothetical protein